MRDGREMVDYLSGVPSKQDRAAQPLARSAACLRTVRTSKPSQSALEDTRAFARKWSCRAIHALHARRCAYLLAQWEPLTRHLQHGQTRLDTNGVENAIRPTKLGAKNWLFVGHPDAGQRSAIIYSMVGSCRRHGIDPLLYLRDVLTRLPTMTNRDDLAGLLPSKWKPGTAASK